jgi:putative Mg2+ transporter-C (MgtC) family protein
MEESVVPILIGWHEIAVRLALTFLAGALIGVDRGEHRRPVGMRTTLLLSLAACVAMLQANEMMNSTGKSSDSFVVLDLMRLPLGILSGVGFIGAGAIVKKGDLVLGVTTAATMWFATVMGLCFGGGQKGLGIAAFALAMLVLTVMKWLEKQLPRQQNATVSVTFAAERVRESELREALVAEGRKIVSWANRYENGAKTQRVECKLRWRSRRSPDGTPAFVEQWAHRDGIAELEWRSVGND